MESARAPVRADLFDPASLASLGHVEIIARWVVDGFLTGLHRSPKKGFDGEGASSRWKQIGPDASLAGAADPDWTRFRRRRP